MEATVQSEMVHHVVVSSSSGCLDCCQKGVTAQFFKSKLQCINTLKYCIISFL